MPANDPRRCLLTHGLGALRPRLMRFARALLAFAWLAALAGSGVDDPTPEQPTDGRSWREARPALLASDLQTNSLGFPCASPASLHDLARDTLLTDLLYSKPERMARDDTASGAVGVNARWEAGLRSTWFIEEQRYGADFVQAGLVRGDPALVARGWKILDWGLTRQDVQGGFSGSGDAFHSTSMFVEALARAVLLTQQSRSADASRVLATYRPKLVAAARWLTSPAVMTQGDAFDTPYTHRRWILAAALGETAAALRCKNAGSSPHPYREEFERFERLATSYAERGMALQRADGVNPEKGGIDTSYQAYGILMAERYATTCTSSDHRLQVFEKIVLGLRWLSTKIDAQGRVATAHDRRTGVEASRLGTIKAVDYKTMIQAFSGATTLTLDPTVRDVARDLAIGRGWAR